MAELALSYRFEVTIDGVASLGTWTECSGLTAEYEVETYQEGGQNGFEHKIPGRLKFTNITLKRPLDAQSTKVAAWFSQLQAKVQRHTASIAVYDGQKEEVVSWTLTGVVPVKWSGPSFDAGTNDVAVETLELAHQGFTAGA